MANNEANTKVVTGLVRFSYVHIFEPSAMDDSSDEKYSVCIIIPKSDKKTIAAINAAVETAKGRVKPQSGKGKFPQNSNCPCATATRNAPTMKPSKTVSSSTVPAKRNPASSTKTYSRYSTRKRSTPAATAA